MAPDAAKPQPLKEMSVDLLNKQPHSKEKVAELDRRNLAMLQDYVKEQERFIGPGASPDTVQQAMADIATANSRIAAIKERQKIEKRAVEEAIRSATQPKRRAVPDLIGG